MNPECRKTTAPPELAQLGRPLCRNLQLDSLQQDVRMVVAGRNSQSEGGTGANAESPRTYRLSNSITARCSA